MPNIIIVEDTQHNLPKASALVGDSVEQQCCSDEKNGNGNGNGNNTGIHNDLLSIQGGSSTERYHLIKRLYDALQVSAANSGNKFITQADIGTSLQDLEAAVQDLIDSNVTINQDIADLQAQLLDLDGPGMEYTVDGKLTLALESKTLVSPTISPNWTLYQNNGTTPYTVSSSTSKNITVDKGVKADLIATYSYPAPTSTQAAPTSVSGNWGTVLPSPNTSSSPLILDDVVATATYTTTLAKPKSGLVVVGSQVQFPSGNDTTSDSISVTFASRSYLGYATTTTLTASEILALSNNILTNTKARTVSPVTATTGMYTYIVYDASLGALSNIIMDGAAPVLGAFTRLSDVVVTSLGGISVTMAVYKSNGTAAFTNNSLAIT